MKRSIAFLVTFALLAALSLLLPGLTYSPYPRPLGPRLAPYPRQSYLTEIEARQAQVVLLGDSMLRRGVDAAALENLLGQPVVEISPPGSASAAWYLITRHNIALAEPPPRVLVIVFRGSLLTVPDYRVHGEYYTDIVYENTAPDDSLFVLRAYIDRMGRAERLAEQYLPIYGQRLDVRAAIDARLRYGLPALMQGCDPDCADLAMEQIFNANNLEGSTLDDAIAAAEAYLYTPDNLDFDARVGESFLPEIIRMTRERGIRLVLVRFKTLIFPDRAARPSALQDYMADLRAYLADSGVLLLDYASDPRILAEYFADPFHLTGEGQAVFTRILAEDLQTILGEQR